MFNLGRRWPWGLRLLHCHSVLLIIDAAAQTSESTMRLDSTIKLLKLIFGRLQLEFHFWVSQNRNGNFTEPPLGDFNNES